MSKQDQDNLRSIRRDIVEVGFKCGETAHLGGAFSMVELLYVLYADFLRVSPSTVTNETRDIFILSKGHGFLGLLSTLNYYKYISDKEAAPGTLKELFHICRISSDGQTGHISYERFLNFGKRTATEFAGVDMNVTDCGGVWQVYNFLPHSLAFDFHL